MPTPRRRPPSLGNTTNVCPSIPITPRHARRARRLFRNHTSPDSPSPLLYIGELEPPPYVPYPVSVLDCCLPRSVLVAYIFPLARPLARHRNRLLFPPLCVRIFAASRLEPSVTPVHGTTNRAVEATWAHHGLRHHGALSHPPRIHTHTPRSPTHSPAAARITIRVHRSPSIPARVFVSGTLPILSSFPSYHELTRRLTTYVTLRNTWCKVWAHAVDSGLGLGMDRFRPRDTCPCFVCSVHASPPNPKPSN